MRWRESIAIVFRVQVAASHLVAQAAWSPEALPPCAAYQDSRLTALLRHNCRDSSDLAVSGHLSRHLGTSNAPFDFMVTPLSLLATSSLSLALCPRRHDALQTEEVLRETELGGHREPASHVRTLRTRTGLATECLFKLVTIFIAKRGA